MAIYRDHSAAMFPTQSLLLLSLPIHAILFLHNFFLSVFLNLFNSFHFINFRTVLVLMLNTTFITSSAYKIIYTEANNKINNKTQLSRNFSSSASLCCTLLLLLFKLKDYLWPRIKLIRDDNIAPY